MSTWRNIREILTWYVIRLFLAVVLFAALMTAFSIWMWPSSEAEQLYQGIPIDEHLLRMDKIALEKAYEQHVLLLFSVWLKDDISVVHRINTGLRRGREAYSQAAARIEEREKILRERQ